MPDHIYRKFDIPFDDSRAERYARKYVELRSELIEDPSHYLSDEIFVGLSLDADKIKEIIQKHTTPNRSSAGTYRDIYRSDLGELMLVHYFEDGIKTTNLEPEDKIPFTIPVKNIYDRELNDLPGRGLDLLGFRLEPKLSLLVGESKVSRERRNPPLVVHYNDDSIFKSQKKNREDRTYLIRRLSNVAKKLTGRDAKYLMAIILFMERGMEDRFDTIYGCCLVRDSICVDESRDFGKMMSEQSVFEPGFVHFVIPSLQVGIDDAVDLFARKIEELTQPNV